MRIEAHDRLGNPIVAEVTRVVVYDDFNNPVSVAIKHATNWVYVAHVNDPEFLEFLKSIGINRTLIIDRIDATTLPPIK